ncbi:MAG: class I SAM-dependent methyltransferase [Caldilineales bacterium]|nr:class I SAM-dependent methyltransferase [Caldilineales bacterium]MDW8318912.1 class I SAM-dependent methyltransferase [Anaerolineae bacterium]
MEPSVVRRLLDLNQEFYGRLGAAFSQTRGPHQAGLRQLLPYLPAAGSLLDVGCGNGRLAEVLDRAGRCLRYVGVDASEPLLAAAQARASTLRCVQATLLKLDITNEDWRLALPLSQYDGIALLAVLHHLPGWALRRRLMQDLAGLMAPGGMLAVSTWQFLESPRLQRRLVPWEAVGLTPADVDPGDYLLDWRQGGYGLRYCRLINEAELLRLAAEVGLAVSTTFRADGAEGTLNLFAVLTKA